MATGSSSTDFGGLGDNYYVESSGLTSLDPSTDPISVVCWVYRDIEFTSTDRIVWTQLDGSGAGRVFFSLTDTNEYPFTAVGGITLSGSTPVAIDTWTFVSASFPGGTGTVRLYLNAVQDASASRTGEAANGEWRVGAHKSNTATGNFAGNIAYASIFEEELNPSILQELMWNPFSYPSNMKWHPELIDTTAASFEDKSPSQLGSSTVVGSPVVSTLGPPIFLWGVM